MSDPKIYHYTKGIHISNIVSDGVIKLTAGFSKFGEEPSLSLSINPVFENSILPMRPVLKSGQNSINFFKGSQDLSIYESPEYKTVWDVKEAANLVGGFYRILIDAHPADLMNWYEYTKYCKSKHRIYEKYFAGLADYLYSKGSMPDTLISIRPIPDNSWIGIDVIDPVSMKWNRLSDKYIQLLPDMSDYNYLSIYPVFSSLQMGGIFLN